MKRLIGIVEKNKGKIWVKDDKGIYRSAHSLITLTEQEALSDINNNFLAIIDEKTGMYCKNCKVKTT